MTETLSGTPNYLGNFPQETWDGIHTVLLNIKSKTDRILNCNNEAVIVHKDTPYICIKRFGKKTIALNENGEFIIYDEGNNKVLHEQIKFMAEITDFPNYYYGIINDDEMVFFHFSDYQENPGTISILKLGDSEIVPRLEKSGDLVYFPILGEDGISLIVHNGSIVVTIPELEIDKHGEIFYKVVYLSDGSEALLVKNNNGFILIKNYEARDKYNAISQKIIPNSTELNIITSTRGKTYLLFTIVENNEITYSLLDPVSEKFLFEKAYNYKLNTSGDYTLSISYSMTKPWLNDFFSKRELVNLN